MDINFPLILVLLVFGSGLIWLVDSLFFAKNRRLATVTGDVDTENLSEKHDSSVVVDGQKIEEKVPVLVEYSRSFFPVLLLVLVLRSFLVEPFQIPSASMVPTLQVGDFILVNKFTYGIRLPVVRTKVFDINEPKRGDIMVFFPPHKKQYFIKRVIGLPGDEVRLVNGVLYVNGEQMAQDFVALRQSAGKNNKMPYRIYRENTSGVEHEIHREVIPSRWSGDFVEIVKPGHYFMVGDNRDNSLDSRDWGMVPEENIVGKAFATWMHWETFFSLPSFHRVGMLN